MFKLTNSDSILRGDGAGIPADPKNPDYAAYLDWLADGNTPEPADALFTPAQLRLVEIDNAAKLTPRAFRELVILVTEGFKLTTGGALDFKAMVPGVAQVFTLEEEAIALRGQLTKD